MEVKGVKRKQGDGEEISVDGIGIIKEVKDLNGEDIAYTVEFPIELVNSSPFSKKKWKTSNNSFWILHEQDADKIIRVF